MSVYIQVRITGARKQLLQYKCCPFYPMPAPWRPIFIFIAQVKAAVRRISVGILVSLVSLPIIIDDARILLHPPKQLNTLVKGRVPTLLNTCCSL